MLYTKKKTGSILEPTFTFLVVFFFLFFRLRPCRYRLDFDLLDVIYNYQRPLFFGRPASRRSYKCFFITGWFLPFFTSLLLPKVRV